jgi:DHA1 family tetracycline resistance protein-like MFS transporter
MRLTHLTTHRSKTVGRFWAWSRPFKTLFVIDQTGLGLVESFFEAAWRSRLTRMRRASLGTLFLTVFLDLVGFGLIIPFLPALARDLGASDFTAAALTACYSVAQFIAVPIWGRISDRVGRRPVLLWSIAASAIGMVFLGLAQHLVAVFLARLWSGAATANIAVAQAYIADVTTPKERAKGMGIIGMGFGLGFMIGPFIGGELGRFHVIGHQGTLPAFVAAGLSIINVIFALRYLPESLAPEHRTQKLGKVSIIDVAALRKVIRVPGVGLILLIAFNSIFWFAGVQAIFRLFTLDAFKMNIENTGRVLGLVGLISVIVQGGLIGRLNRRFGEVRLLGAALVLMSLGFVMQGLSVSLGVPAFLVASGITALGTALHMPSVSSYISRRVGADVQGATLGTMQSSGALARATGPLLWGLLYDSLGLRMPFYIGAAAIALLLLAIPRLPRLQQN